MVRTPLVQPKAYFEERRADETFFRGVGVAVLSALAMTVLVGGGLWALSRQMTGTGAAGEQFWQGVTDFLPFLFVGLVLIWILCVFCLYVGARIAGGYGPFALCWEIAAWGFVATTVTVAIAMAALVVFSTQLDLSASDVEGITAQLETLQTGTSLLALGAINLGGALWTAHIWAGGLQAGYGIHRVKAWIVAAVLYGFLTLASL